MKKTIGLFLATAALVTLCLSENPVAADPLSATVVATCGTPPTTYNAGFPYPATQDTTGTLAPKAVVAPEETSI